MDHLHVNVSNLFRAMMRGSFLLTLVGSGIRWLGSIRHRSPGGGTFLTWWGGVERRQLASPCRSSRSSSWTGFAAFGGADHRSVCPVLPFCDVMRLLDDFHTFSPCSRSSHLETCTFFLRAPCSGSHSTRVHACSLGANGRIPTHFLREGELGSCGRGCAARTWKSTLLQRALHMAVGGGFFTAEMRCFPRMLT